MKVQVKKAFKSYFCHQKSNTKAHRLYMKFPSASNIFHELEPKKMGIWLRRVEKI